MSKGLFTEYAERLAEAEANVPKIFKKAATSGALYFTKTATELTDQEGLVDTGNYKRNWSAKAVKEGEDNAIIMVNNVEYASHLEWGHKLRNGEHWKGRFIGKRAKEDTEGEVLYKLREEIEIALTMKKYNLSRSEAKAYLK